jgi:hypothetical protein
MDDFLPIYLTVLLGKHIFVVERWAWDLMKSCSSFSWSFHFRTVLTSSSPLVVKNFPIRFALDYCTRKIKRQTNPSTNYPT